MDRFGQRERRLLAILILLAVVALLYFIAVQPIMRGFSARSAQRVITTLHYQRNERVIASIPKLRRALEAQEPERRKFVLAVRDQSSAQDYLQERLRTVLAATGSDLSGAETIETLAGYAATSGSARLSYPQLLHTVQRLQEDQPYVLLDGITIVANQALVSGQLDTMDVKIDLSIPFSPASAPQR